MQILCYGDSNTFGYNPQNGGVCRYAPENRWVDKLCHFSGWSCCNRGENGRQIPHTQREMEQAKRMLAANAKADLVIVMLGTNDLLNGLSAQQAGERMALFLKEIVPLCQRLLLVSPPPLCRGEWVAEEDLLNEAADLGRVLKDLSSHAGVEFADAADWHLPMAFDGVHLTEEGHDSLAKNLWKRLI